MRPRATVLAVPIALAIWAAPAQAGIECAVEQRAEGPALALTTTAFADVAAIVRDGDEIAVSDDRMIQPVACAGGPAAVHSVDSIEMATDQEEASLYLDLAGGPLEPGFTAEEFGESEIELSVTWQYGFFGVGGTDEADVFDFSGTKEVATGRLNADADADVTVALPANILLRGNRGRDDLFAGPLRAPVNLDGGPGADGLAGGRKPDFVDGGGGADVILTLEGGRDDVDCGPGRDRVTADRGDGLSNCERVTR